VLQEVLSRSACGVSCVCDMAAMRLGPTQSRLRNNQDTLSVPDFKRNSRECIMETANGCEIETSGQGLASSRFTREVLNGLLRIGFEHHQQIIWDKGRNGFDQTALLVSARAVLVPSKENAPWFGKADENCTIWAAPGRRAGPAVWFRRPYLRAPACPGRNQ
jgi:hypothetical protein